MELSQLKPDGKSKQDVIIEMLGIVCEKLDKLLAVVLPPPVLGPPILGPGGHEIVPLYGVRGLQSRKDVAQTATSEKESLRKSGHA